MKTESRISVTRHASISLKKILSKNYDHVGTTCDSDLESSHLGERNLIFMDPPILIKN